MKEDDIIELTYEVTCSTCVDMLAHSKGNNYQDKVDQLHHDCEEAIEEQMRHWGDFSYFIDCVRDRLIDYNTDENGIVKIENDYRADYILNNDKAKQVIEEYTNIMCNLIEKHNENNQFIETWDIRPMLQEFAKKIINTL